MERARCTQSIGSGWSCVRLIWNRREHLSMPYWTGQIHGRFPVLDFIRSVMFLIRKASSRSQSWTYQGYLLDRSLSIGVGDGVESQCGVCRWGAVGKRGGRKRD